jgi:hypothetical protein
MVNAGNGRANRVKAALNCLLTQFARWLRDCGGETSMHQQDSIHAQGGSDAPPSAFLEHAALALFLLLLVAIGFAFPYL